MKKRILILTTLLFLAILIVTGLYFNMRNHVTSNGFVRYMRPTWISQRKGIDINYNSWYIAGMNKNNVYLGNFASRGDLLVTDDSLNSAHTLQLKLPDNGKMLSNIFRIKVDSGGIYLTDGLIPMILRSADTSQYLKRYTYDKLNFLECIPLSESTFILRSLDTITRQNYIVKQAASEPHAKTSHKLLQKQVDGFFCTDGILNYDQSIHVMVYTYFYRNEFICFDTSLNLLYRGKTIDTTRYARIKVATTESGLISTLASPPFTVNKRSVVSDGLLYIHSVLRADNETEENFNSYSAIDIYSLDKGEYKFSIYLNEVNGKKLSQFYVENHKLFAIHDHYLVVYDLTF